MPRSRPARALLVASALMLAGCAPLRVSSHVDSQADFTRFKTFAWGPADALPAGDPRLDESGFFQDHMQGAVERQMVSKGYEYAGERDVPDVRIHFHAVTRGRLNPDDGATTFEEGTLIVDVMNGRTDRLVWRGWAQDTVGDSLENQDALAKRIDRAVRSLMVALPGRR